MKRHLVRALVNSAVLIGLVALCSGISSAQSAGETLFKTKCAACHGPDGKGESAISMRFPQRWIAIVQTRVARLVLCSALRGRPDKETTFF